MDQVIWYGEPGDILMVILIAIVLFGLIGIVVYFVSHNMNKYEKSIHDKNLLEDQIERGKLMKHV